MAPSRRRLYHPLPLTDGQLALWARCPEGDPWVEEHLGIYAPPPALDALVAGGRIGELAGWAARALASNPALSGPAIGALASTAPRTDPIQWGRWLALPAGAGFATNPSAPPGSLAGAARFAAGVALAGGSLDAGMVVRILSNPAIGPDMARDLWGHEALRPELLCNPALGPEIRLSWFFDDATRHDIGPPVVASLGRGEIESLMREVRSRRMSPEWLVNEILAYGELPERVPPGWGDAAASGHPLCNNPRAPREWIAAAMAAPGPTRRSLLHLPDAPLPPPRALAGELAARGTALASHQLADASGRPAPFFAAALMDDHRIRPKAQIGDWDLRCLRNPWLPREIAEAYAAHRSPEARKAVASNPCLCDVGLMGRLAADRSPSVRAALAAHPLLVFHPIQRRLAASTDASILAALRSNPAVARHGIHAPGLREPLPDPFFPDRAAPPGEEAEEEEPEFPAGRAAAGGEPGPALGPGPRR